MSLQRINTNPLDPNNNTFAIARAVGNIVRTGTVTYDVDFTEYARWIYIGTTGNLSYVKWDGSTETLPSMVAGVWHPICAVRINTSGTSIAANQLRWGS